MGNSIVDNLIMDLLLVQFLQQVISLRFDYIDWKLYLDIFFVKRPDLEYAFLE